MTNPSAGWYADPKVPQQMRWWDGQAWSADTYQRVEPFDDWTATASPASTLNPTSAVGSARSVTDARGPTTTDGVPLAQWGYRAAARVIDTMVTWLLTCAIGIRPLTTAAESFLEQIRAGMRAGQLGQRVSYVEDPATVRALAILSLTWLAVSLAYDLIFLVRRGATPGKILLGLRVRRWEPDQPLTSSRVGVRWFTSTVLSSIGIAGLGLIYGLADALTPLRHPRRQSLHDRFARTCVVRAPRGENRKIAP